MNTYNLEPNYRDDSLITLYFVVLEISIPSFHIVFLTWIIERNNWGGVEAELSGGNLKVELLRGGGNLKVELLSGGHLVNDGSRLHKIVAHGGN